jgi:multidrug efflux pump subunit AcrA (membrane-fusion protein)
MEMQIDIPNPKHLLKPGMFAHVMVPVEQRRGVVTVPVMAVLDRQGPVVLAINGEGALEERRVKKGLATPERIEILEGLQEGDTVVAANAGQLKAGDRVTPKMMTAEASR